MVIFWAKVKSKIFHVKLVCLLLENFGLLFNSASGHSAVNVKMLTHSI